METTINFTNAEQTRFDMVSPIARNVGTTAPQPPRDSVPERQRASNPEWADERGLDLGPDANLPLWDGTRPDYDVAVAALLAHA
jgi:hypothetical protein